MTKRSESGEGDPMSDRTVTPTTPLYELVLERTFDAPPELVYRCWTEPELLKRWFTPAPWSTSHAELDVRPGGSSLVVMKDPEGNEHPNPGVYLEVVPNRKIVFTDAYVDAWTPAENPFFTGVITVRTQRHRHEVHRTGSPLDQGEPGQARADGLPRGLGGGGEATRGTAADAVAPMVPVPPGTAGSPGRTGTRTPTRRSRRRASRSR
jgi:uncharacterized protein YndB with AHSA1/START domain